MADFEILATNHTSFTVSDLSRILPFFEEGLGFEVTSKAPRDPQLIQSITGVDGADVITAYVRGPGHSVELIQYNAPKDRKKIRPNPCDVGFAHIAYDVTDINHATTTAINFGFNPVGKITTIDQGPNAGRQVVYLRDIDGITIEFIETRPKAAK